MARLIRTLVSRDATGWAMYHLKSNTGLQALASDLQITTKLSKGEKCLEELQQLFDYMVNDQLHPFDEDGVLNQYMKEYRFATRNA